MTLTAPPQARQVSMSPKAPTFGEHPLQALVGPGHGCPTLHGSSRTGGGADTQRNDRYR
jgi:hypothetical protein